MAGRPFLSLYPKQAKAGGLCGKQKLPRQYAGGAWKSYIFTQREASLTKTFLPLGYFRNFVTARATMPPRMPETRNSATPCTPTSRTTNIRGLAAPLADTRFWT